MAEQDMERSESGISAEKSDTTILKSLSSLDPRKSHTSNFPSDSGSILSLQNAVSILAVRKLVSKDSLDLRKEESRSSVREVESENPHGEADERRDNSATDFNTEKSSSNRKRTTKYMRDYPELFRDDVSINPSYTGLRKFPYNVICRQRFHNNKMKINRQLNKEIENITMMQTLALDGVRVGRIFSVGFHSSQTIVKDFATPSERIRLNEILSER